MKSFSDMYFIAAIISYSPKSFDHVEKDNRRKQEFYFKDDVSFVFTCVDGEVEKQETPTLEELQNWYTAGTLMFLPNYPDAIRKVKTEVHSP